MCSNTLPDRKMTQQQANILNKFYIRALDKADRFWYFKNMLTLVIYFTTIKQLLVYYYQVVYSKDSHFTRAQVELGKQVLLANVIQPTA